MGERKGKRNAPSDPRRETSLLVLRCVADATGLLDPPPVSLRRTACSFESRTFRPDWRSLRRPACRYRPVESSASTTWGIIKIILVSNTCQYLI